MMVNDPIFNAWCRAVDAALSARHIRTRVKQLDPFAVDLAFQSGINPHAFANTDPLPIGPPPPSPVRLRQVPSLLSVLAKVFTVSGWTIWLTTLLLATWAASFLGGTLARISRTANIISLEARRDGIEAREAISAEMSARQARFTELNNLNRAPTALAPEPLPRRNLEVERIDQQIEELGKRPFAETIAEMVAQILARASPLIALVTLLTGGAALGAGCHLLAHVTRGIDATP